jgi:hypothetical protein
MKDRKSESTLKITPETIFDKNLFEKQFYEKMKLN